MKNLFKKKKKKNSDVIPPCIYATDLGFCTLTNFRSSYIDTMICMSFFYGYLKGHLKSRRPDSIWAGWVSNTLTSCNLAPEYWNLRLVDLVSYFIWVDCN